MRCRSRSGSEGTTSGRASLGTEAGRQPGETGSPSGQPPAMAVSSPKVAEGSAQAAQPVRHNRRGGGPSTKVAPGERLAGQSLWGDGPLGPAGPFKGTRFFLEPRSTDHPVLWASSHHEHPEARSHIGKGVVRGLGSAFQFVEGQIICHSPSWISGTGPNPKLLRKHTAVPGSTEALPHGEQVSVCSCSQLNVSCVSGSQSPSASLSRVGGENSTHFLRLPHVG